MPLCNDNKHVGTACGIIGGLGKFLKVADDLAMAITDREPISDAHAPCTSRGGVLAVGFEAKAPGR